MEIKIKYRNNNRNEGQRDTHRYKSTDCGKDTRLWTQTYQTDRKKSTGIGKF